MLSAAVSHHVLEIEGTGRADTIVLTMASPRTLTVRVGDAETSFSRKSFGKIRIAAGRGDDLVTVGSDAAPVTAPVSVTGGEGSDTIVGGAGNDKLSGGGGADLITGGSGDDKIAGDNGNDDLHGGDGRDSITGGRGDDQLHDDAGRDAVYGNVGTDTCYFHDDVKQFRDAGKHEGTYNEPVFQVLSATMNDLALNICPLYAADGTSINGGLVKVGGSTLILAGNAVGQWGGDGLAVTNTPVPHFDIPGGGAVTTGSSGSLNITSGSIISLTGTNLFNTTTGVTNGAVTVIDTNLNSYTGSVTLNGGTLNVGGTVDVGGAGSIFGAHPFLLDAGSILTAADGTTRTLVAGESLTVTGPSQITTPGGATLKVSDGFTVQVTVKPAASGDGTTTTDTGSDNTTTTDTGTDGTSSGDGSMSTVVTGDESIAV